MVSPARRHRPAARRLSAFVGAGPVPPASCCGRSWSPIPTSSSSISNGDQVEGYHILVGGGFGADGAIAQLIHSDVKAEDAPRQIERLLGAYLAHRSDPAESLQQFTQRHDCEALKRLAVEIVESALWLRG